MDHAGYLGGPGSSTEPFGLPGKLRERLQEAAEGYLESSGGSREPCGHASRGFEEVNLMKPRPKGLPP